jgi:hypothetical protein
MMIINEDYSVLLITNRVLLTIQNKAQGIVKYDRKLEDY